MRLILLGLVVCLHLGLTVADLPECAKESITYAYTECDKDNGRWRVAVPRDNGCTIHNPPAPIRGKDCNFSCAKGHYLDLDTQECRICPVGTYSLGSGIRFNIWNNVPEGFLLSSNPVSFAEYGYHSRSGNCSGSVWKAQKEYISSNDDDCSSSLSYSVEVRDKGTVTFKYQYVDEDIIFHFYIQNSECQTLQGHGMNVFLNTTGTSWGAYKTKLNTGTNVLYWKTTGILLSNKDKVSPVLIKDIEITGVSYTTHCHKCREGYYSDAEGSQWCRSCPENTKSDLGANKCEPCDPKTQYAPSNSAECKARPPCTEKDYFETHSPCNENKTTKVMYEWVDSSMCNRDSPQSIELPESGVTKECSPCNPGFSLADRGHCVACEKEMYSNGKEDCMQCPASTAPVYGYNYLWWDELPSNMNVSCLTIHSDECVGKNGWYPGAGYLETSPGQVPNAFLLLILHVHGFRAPVVLPDRQKEYGTVTFAFEMMCKGNCVMYFMQEMHGKGTHVINSWHGYTLKKTFSYSITENITATFTWAFQKTSSQYDYDLVKDDKARVYLINVTNEKTAPATHCRSCVTGINENGCIPCPAGYFIESDTKKCKQCPPGTYISSENIHQTECQKCEAGTKSNSDHTACFNDCSFTSELDGRVHDFSFFSTPQVSFTPPSFTNSGRKYVHYYNISLCGNNGLGSAHCIDNVTMSFDNTGPSKKITSMVCRSTKLSNVGAGGEEVIVFSQPQDISSRLAKIYQVDMNATEDNPLIPTMKNQMFGDVIYEFKTEATPECLDGASTFVHLRCDPALDEGEIKTEMPTLCPDATCDGCNFNFLWRSLEACPLCTEDDYYSVESGCVDGYVTKKYIWKSYPKSCVKGVKLPSYTKSPCTDLRLYIEIAILAGTVLLVLLCTVMCCLWKKSKKLEYKYQKLVMSSGKNGGELPAADSCAISDSESDDGLEQSDEVVFQKKRARILGKNKTNNYESVSLKPMQHNVV